MNPLLLHLRASPLRWVVLPLTALAVALLLHGPRFWIGIWPETGAAGLIPAFYLSIIAAGIAAWVSGSEGRAGMRAQLAAAAVPRAAIDGVRLGTVVILLLVPYLAGQAVAFALTARSFPEGVHLWLGYAAMGIVVMVLATSWGWIIGRCLGSNWAALAALLSWFAFETFVGDAASLSVLSGPAWQQPDVSALAMRLVVAAGFTAVAAGLPTRATAVAVGAMVLVMAAVTRTAGVTDRAAPAEPLCLRGRIEWCLWPEDARYAPDVLAVDARLGELPAGFRLPARVVEYGLDQQQVTSDGRTFTDMAGDFEVSEGSRWGLAVGVSNAIIDETLEACDWDALHAARDRRPDALRRWIELHLADGTDPDYLAVGVPRHIEEAWATAGRVRTDLTPAEQHAWVRQQLDGLAATACRS